MRVLVSGGCGFIGSHVVELLASKRHDVMILDDLSTGKVEWVKDVIIDFPKKVNFDMCSVQRWDHVEPLIKGFQPEVIVHLAAQPAISTSWDDPLLNAQVNEIGTLNLLMSGKQNRVKRFVFASTSAIYREDSEIASESSPKEPKSPYGISKLAAETYVRTLFPNSACLRFGNVYGPRQVPIGENQVVPRMLRHFLYGDDFAIHGNGEQTRDFVFVKDVAEAVMRAMWGQVGSYNIASGTSVSVNAVARMVEAIYHVPGYKWAHTKEQDPRQQIRLDVRTAWKELGWKARRPLIDGLHATCDWWDARKKNDQRIH